MFKNVKVSNYECEGECYCEYEDGWFMKLGLEFTGDFFYNSWLCELIYMRYHMFTFTEIITSNDFTPTIIYFLYALCSRASPISLYIFHILTFILYPFLSSKIFLSRFWKFRLLFSSLSYLISVLALLYFTEIGVLVWNSILF